MYYTLGATPLGVLLSGGARFAARQGERVCDFHNSLERGIVVCGRGELYGL